VWTQKKRKIRATIQRRKNEKPETHRSRWPWLAIFSRRKGDSPWLIWFKLQFGLYKYRHIPRDKRICLWFNPPLVGKSSDTDTDTADELNI